MAQPFHEVFWGELREALKVYGDCEVHQSGAIIRYPSGVETRREYWGEYDLPGAYCVALSRSVSFRPVQPLLDRLSLIKAAIKTHSRQDLLVRIKYDCSPGRLVAYNTFEELLVRAKVPIISSTTHPTGPENTDATLVGQAILTADLADLQASLIELESRYVGTDIEEADLCEWAATLQRIASIIERHANPRLNETRATHLQKRKQLYFDRYANRDAGPFDQYRNRVRPRLTKLMACYERIHEILSNDAPILKIATDIEPAFEAELLDVLETAHRSEQKIEELTERLESSNRIIEHLTGTLAGYQECA